MSATQYCLREFEDGARTDASFEVLDIVALNHKGFLVNVCDPAFEGRMGFLLKVKIMGRGLSGASGRTQHYLAFVLADLSRWCYMMTFNSERLRAFNFTKGNEHMDFNRIDFYRIKMAVDKFMAEL